MSEVSGVQPPSSGGHQINQGPSHTPVPFPQKFIQGMVNLICGQIRAAMHAEQEQAQRQIRDIERGK